MKVYTLLGIGVVFSNLLQKRKKLVLLVLFVYGVLPGIVPI
ncbi:hypothetical protein QP420_05660 [Bifidobacterium sp. UMB1197]|nr:hypothetical protein [Bifidobacterium sp. UMB1197]